MRVLLISFLPGIDPACGDVTYTQTLLARPPEGVVYETYSDALNRGTLIEHGRRNRLWREPVLTLGNKALDILRKRRILFWEPFRFFSVAPGAYDLIHLHVFNARFLSIDCALVISSGAPQPELYKDRRNYSSRRVAILSAVERTLNCITQMNSNSFYMPQAQRVIVYTQHFKDYLARHRFMAPDKVAVIPIHLLPTFVHAASRMPNRVGFVARDFDAKGGPVLLRAFEEVRRQRPDVELWVVGSPPRMSDDEAARRGIKWLPSLPREEVLDEIMPSFDVFAYPTPHDCFSYVLLEAMAAGCAIATSDYISMPEAVDWGGAGLISPVNDCETLAANILTLLEPEVNRRFKQAARERFDNYFSYSAVAPRLLEMYQEAITEYKNGADPSQ
jgi:glycosyltransferase involved in cell wall biosynthesis